MEKMFFIQIELKKLRLYFEYFWSQKPSNIQVGSRLDSLIKKEINKSLYILVIDWAYLFINFYKCFW